MKSLDPRLKQIMTSHVCPPAAHSMLRHKQRETTQLSTVSEDALTETIAKPPTQPLHSPGMLISRILLTHFGIDAAMETAHFDDEMWNEQFLLPRQVTERV